MDYNFKRYCKDCLLDVIEICKKIVSTDRLEKYTDINPKFLNGKYDDTYPILMNNYSGFLIKHEEKITSDDSFKLVNIILSEEQTIKKYFKGKVFDNHAKPLKSPDLTPYTKRIALDFIRNYFEATQAFAFDSQNFDLVFSKFKEYILKEINTFYFFSPLHNFNSKISKEEFDNNIQIKKISILEFKDIANLGTEVGKQPDVSSTFWNLTHVICTIIGDSTNFHDDAQKVQKLFSNLIQGLKIFEAGDVQLGAIYRKYSPNWKTNTTQIIGTETHTQSNNKMFLTKQKCTEFKKFYHNFKSIDFTKSEMKFLKTAITRFSSAVDKRDQEDRIVDYVISLESLLLTSPGEASLRLSSRAAILLGDNDNEREFLWKFMRQAYNLRSGIVHGEGKREFTIDGKSYSLNDISLCLESNIRKAIKKMLNLIKAYQEQGKILEKLDVSIFNRSLLTELLTKSEGIF